MIRRVVLRRFKRFGEITFDLPRHVVLVGPNNSGKTTLLQAIAAWDLALRRWRELFDRKKHRGQYSKAPIARQAFVSVPLRTFDLLWNERSTKEPIEIEITGEAGWSLTMEFIPDTTEQIFVRPTRTNHVEVVADNGVRTVFVPPMSGVGLEEPLYASPATLDALLARVRAGDVLRNLLYQASQQEEAWVEITRSVQELFGYHLDRPEARGAFIQADYRARADGPAFDLTSAGSGFQQVLMLLCFLHTRPGSVLLLDEPDAHLHVILQDAIYGELRRIAATKSSQLVVATHSEVIVNAAELEEIRVTFDPSRTLTDPRSKQSLRKALRWVSNVEVTQALTAPGILYLEDYTDLEILRAWARVLRHRCLPLLTTELFWRKTTVESPAGQEGIAAKDHYEALRLVRELPGLILIDGDARESIESTPITGGGLQRLRWRRYEIESYLVHPRALSDFVAHVTGEEAPVHTENLQRWFLENYPALVRDPLGDHPILRRLKAREEILPPALSAAGLPGFRYTDYHEIAASMRPEDIHPEVVEKLDLICKAFGR